MQVPLGAYYRKRLSRIVPALVAWHVVYVLFELRVLGWSLTPRIVLVDLWHGRTYTALYFFWLILGLYVVAPLLWRLVRRPVRARAAAIALGCTAAALVWGSVTGIVAGPDVRAADLHRPHLVDPVHRLLPARSGAGPGPGHRAGRPADGRWCWWPARRHVLAGDATVEQPGTRT